MNIHEYQAKALLQEYGVPIPFGGLAYSPEQAAYRAKEIGGDRWVVKAQVHTGAIVTGSGESATEKIEIMRKCRIPVIERPSDFGTAIAKMI